MPQPLRPHATRSARNGLGRFSVRNAPGTRWLSRTNQQKARQSEKDGTGTESGASRRKRSMREYRRRDRHSRHETETVRAYTQSAGNTGVHPTRKGKVPKHGTGPASGARSVTVSPPGRGTARMVHASRTLHAHAAAARLEIVVLTGFARCLLAEVAQVVHELQGKIPADGQVAAVLDV